MNRSLISIFALAAALTTGGPGMAQETLQTRVSYSDLDLAKAEGRATFARRIEAAVQLVCGDADRSDFVAMQIQRACRKDARMGVRRPVEQAIAAVSGSTRLASR